ncbi:MAG: mechanosensitive ion channel [Deltaproteobacteria bacterium]|nr:mechanosensitive ion channel [Deltaproteobacteria bacterium]
MSDLFPNFLKPYFPQIWGVLTALVILVGGWLLSKLTGRVTLRATEKARLDPALARFFSALARYAVLAATLIAALGAAGIKTASFLAVLATAGLAIGMALQGSLSHFASGVMLLVFRPFTLGDVVTAAGHTGKVEDIGLFATTLVNPNNEKIIVPNSKITGDSIVNLTTLGVRRGAVEVGVAYGADPERVKSVLLAAASSVDLVLDDPAPAIGFTGLGASSIDFTVFAWCNSPDYIAMLGAVRQAVYDQLKAAGIEIPYNQVVVHQAAA